LCINKYNKEEIMGRLLGSKPAEFSLYAPNAKRVSLAGTFNNWDVQRLTARKDSRGNWSVKASLKPGKYEYKFFVDGSWHNDPKCKACVPNSFGTTNCTVEIR
jgi:1,4-alpha-glucan branching enzyme